MSRKATASRVNGSKSRGPRSAAGKARASRNALRHGLAAIPQREESELTEAERSAKMMCEYDDDPLLLNEARIVSDCDILLRQVSAQKLTVIERLCVNERDEVDSICDALPDLLRFARYERRAWSRRKRALRRFMAIKSTAD